MSLSVFSPISIGNVSVGFDTLGLALAPIDGSLIGDTVSIKKTPDEQSVDQFEMVGSHANKLPADKQQNIAWKCLLSFNQALSLTNISRQPIKLTLHKNIPVSSGLGSSACSVVASFVALNEFYQRPFNKLDLLRMMGKLEADISGSLHYDNVAPCFLGGLQLMLNDPNKISQSLPTFDELYWVIAYPDVTISTKQAREILPKVYSRQTLVTFGQNLAGFIDASHRKDKQQAFKLMSDVVAEPYRIQLLPNFTLAKNVLTEFGSLAVGISGSGPTIFAVCDSLSLAQQCQQWLELNYLQSKDGFVHICKIDHQGSRRI